jgi:hypothetical protein
MQLICTAGIQNELCSLRSKLAGTSLANTAGCTGYQYNLIHVFSIFKVFNAVKLNDFYNFADRNTHKNGNIQQNDSHSTEHCCAPSRKYPLSLERGSYHTFHQPIPKGSNRRTG